MNRQILISLLVVGIVGAIASGTTLAYFNDTETSQDNTFSAGALDLQVDWNESYNGEFVERQPLTDNPGAIFDINDVKPGDEGEATVSLHLFDNPGYIWMNVTQTANNDNSCTEPEAEAEGGDCGTEGELGEHMMFTVWMDDDGDNVHDEGENVLYNGTAHEMEPSLLLDGDTSTDEKEAFENSTTHYVGFKWHVPAETGNEIQTDSKVYDISFYAEQERHNPQDQEPVEEPPQEPGEENETVYYQVDLATGEVINNLSQQTYNGRGDMIGWFHGSSEMPKDNETIYSGDQLPDCINEASEYTVEGDQASINFTVDEASKCQTGTNVTIVSYVKPFPGWIADRAGEQEVFDYTTENLDAGEHTHTVELPVDHSQ
jgi:predicted ribosomally synthesized peptide with SipW-like signal peptide